MEAQYATNDHIYFQDDDVQVDVHRLFQHYDGERMTYAITQGHKAIYDRLCGSKVCLIGWGCFVPKRLTNQQRWHPYVDRFGVVPPHEVDRAFTYFAGEACPVVTPKMRFCNRERAMSRDNPTHYQSRDRIIKQLMECPR